MCPHCIDLARTDELLSDLVAYESGPDADPEFADVVGDALTISFELALGTQYYPPPGHGYPAAD
ncbi:hypothetical protein FBY35_6730 [Streptomyces sp. SLBN-118]|uniref:hypothetical protein n=1 Tax=Streptomyces sp. SLBN-118 TaxID=2768454 RepID=UPI00114E5405|nr:hypothetical protein [Streptomyces sp. SLBN-118]TQK45179.1 hypothetical protein FBY35_6730 [Streptomyces sp. SLBN-118]